MFLLVPFFPLYFPISIGIFWQAKQLKLDDKSSRVYERLQPLMGGGEKRLDLVHHTSSYMLGDQCQREM